MDKSHEEILRSRDMKEVLDWIKKHPGQECKDVSDLFHELAYNRFVASVVDAFGSYDPENHYDFDPKKKP